MAGALAPAASYGLGGIFGHTLGSLGNEMLRAGAHGLTSGSLNSLRGGNFSEGLWSGFASSIVGSGAQFLHFGPREIVTSSALAGGLTSWAMGGSFRNGFSIGATIGTYNHTGEDVKTIERKLPPVYVYGKDLSYHKTFGYWLLGVGGGASLGPYGMWNPDAFDVNIGGTLQFGPFCYSGNIGWVTSGSHGAFYMSCTGGATSQVGLGGGFQVSGNFYMNKTTQRLSINDYAGKGYEYGFDLLGVSLNYGGGVTPQGLLDTSSFSYIGIGIGAGLGIHGNVVNSNYLFSY